jgi:hypothetical protein
MPYKVKTLLLALNALFLDSAASRHNLAYHATTQVSPGLFDPGCYSSTTSVATDGFMTQYAGNNCAAYYGYLLHT